MNAYTKTAHLANIWFDGAIISTSAYRQVFVVASSQSSNKLVVEIKISVSFPHTQSCSTSHPEPLILPLTLFLLLSSILFKKHYYI